MKDELPLEGDGKTCTGSSCLKDSFRQMSYEVERRAFVLVGRRAYVLVERRANVLLGWHVYVLVGRQIKL